MVDLLDANVLIALSAVDHTEHARARAWFNRDHPFATCPITQGALIRFHLRWSGASSIQAAKALLGRICALPSHQFWAADASCLDLPELGVLGHKQVTDAYLVLLASRNQGRLATMDEALAAVHPTAFLI
jgi:uncharacterized protein